MDKPFSFELKEKRLLRSDSYTVLLYKEPICIFSMDANVVEAYVNNLNAAFNLGVAIGETSSKKQQAATHGILSENPYQFYVDDDFDELGFPLVAMHIRMPDSSLTSLDHLSVDAAKSFVTLMNKAHTLGVASGLSNPTISPTVSPCL